MTMVQAMLSLTLLLGLAAPPAAAQERRLHPERVTFPGDDGQMLVGDLWKPEGKGPFPALVWNHGSFVPGTPMGSERKMMKKHAPLARFYTSHGYLIFFPSRHGHVESPFYAGEMEARERELKANRDIVGQHEFWNLDVQAAIRYLKTRPEVDAGRMVVTGYSYGGIQTLLTAERGSGMRAAVCFAPGAQSWGDRRVRERLLKAVKRAPIPIFLLQASNDYSIGPSEVLGPVLRRKGPRNRAQLYPAFGSTPGDGHGGFAMNGEEVWGADVLDFLDRELAPAAAQ